MIGRLLCRIGLHRWSPHRPIMSRGCYHRCLRPGCTVGVLSDCREAACR